MAKHSEGGGGGQNMRHTFEGKIPVRPSVRRRSEVSGEGSEGGSQMVGLPRDPRHQSWLISSRIVIMSPFENPRSSGCGSGRDQSVFAS